MHVCQNIYGKYAIKYRQINEAKQSVIYILQRWHCEAG